MKLFSFKYILKYLVVIIFIIYKTLDNIFSYNMFLSSYITSPQYSSGLISFNSYITYVIIGENISLTIVLLFFIYYFFSNSLNFYYFPNFEGINPSNSFLKNSNKIYLIFFNKFISFNFNLDLVVLFFLYNNLLIFSNNFDFLSSDSLIVKPFNYAVVLLVRQWGWDLEYIAPFFHKRKYYISKNKRKYISRMLVNIVNFQNINNYICNISSRRVLMYSYNDYNRKYILSKWVINFIHVFHLAKWVICNRPHLYKMEVRLTYLICKLYKIKFDMPYPYWADVIHFFYKYCFHRHRVRKKTYGFFWFKYTVYNKNDILLGQYYDYVIERYVYKWRCTLLGFFEKLYTVNVYRVGHITAMLYKRYLNSSDSIKGSVSRSKILNNILMSNFMIYMTSLDVIHSVFIKNIAVKLDVFYGKVSVLNLGDYLSSFNNNTYLEFICYEYCGLYHSDMFTSYLLVESIDASFISYIFT